MRCGSLLWLVLAACNGAGLGDRCSTTDDCGVTLQCVSNVCRARCERAPDCGDGYSCDDNGICHEASGNAGDSCTSEVDCDIGFACELSGDVGDQGLLAATCVQDGAGHPAGATCDVDADCRNQTCALGRCIDLCKSTRDCGVGMSCTQIPRVEAQGAMFAGCLQSAGSLAWNIPMHGASETLKLPVPAIAQSIAVTMHIDDPNQMVGVTHLTAPDGSQLLDSADGFFMDPVRHQPGLGQSVLALPSSPDSLLVPDTNTLVPGAYTMDVRSLKPPFDATSIGTATPTVTAVVKLDSSVILDLHFYFLNFEDHPCAAKFGAPGILDATTAAAQPFFQTDFLATMRTIFSSGGVALGTLTYEDLLDSPDLDGLDIANAGELLKLGTHPVGVNVFFVRSISPGGLQAYGPNPGPAGLPKTAQSGVIVALDSLCYREWTDVARVAAHEVARFMGLYDNVEIDQSQTDPISDSDTSSNNLMFYSELGGISLSSGQREILSRSPVLR
jgi:hypothetical protein